MKKVGVVLVVLVVMAFTTSKVEKEDAVNTITALKIQKDILEFQDIITQKQLEAASLQTKANELAETDSEVSMKLLEKVNLLRMNCLKYQAAIACLQQHLE